MTYTEVSFQILPYSQYNEEILIVALEKIGFDSFWQDNEILKGYIFSNNFSLETIVELQKQYEKLFSISFSFTELPDKNWNEEWEKNFKPIIIGNKCLVRAPFHERQNNTEYDIIIEPKMSFGTGHHSTTSLMIEHLLDLDINNKSVLDMGCGTGILSILASKMNANNIIAIDNDVWAYENTLENINKNNCKNIDVILGNVNSIDSMHFDIILANINRNIILEDMEKYLSFLNKKGMLLISGFLSIDREIILKKAHSLNLESIQSAEKKEWISEVLIQKL